MLKKLLLVLIPIALWAKPPAWMKMQIESDISQYRNRSISHTEMRQYFSTPDTPFFYVRFIIKNNVVRGYPSQQLIDSYLYPWYDTFYKTLVNIAKKRKLPDVTFFACMMDNYKIHSDFPLFVCSKVKESSGLILMPDPYNLRGDYNVVSVVNNPPKWNSKRASILWRGTTGQYTLPDYGMSGREILCRLAEKYPGYIDAGFTFSYWPEKLEEQELLGQYGKDWASFEDLLRYKYLLWMDGYVASYSESGWRLFANALVFKPDSPHIQWYYNALKPYKHYVPVKDDLSDLIAWIDWARAHDYEAEKIAKRARKFALESITSEASKEYLYHLL